jgi:hypothetical protein
MEIVINPTASRIWRTPNSLQIGLSDARVVLENLQPRHEAFIDALYQGLTLRQAQSYARHLKMRVAEAQALITALEPVLLRQTQRRRQVDNSGNTLETEIAAGEFAEVASLPIDSPAFQQALGEMNQASLQLCARGESVWLLRQKRAVFVGSLDRTGQLIARGLAEAGVGAIVTGDLTSWRLEALRNSFATMPTPPQLVTLEQLSESQICRIDLAILVGQQLIEPQKFAAWMNRSTPTIAAIFASAADALRPLVSHVIVPGISPCWVCLELARLENDRAWPDMASQLIGRELQFDSASASLTLAGKILEQCIGYLDFANGFAGSHKSSGAGSNPALVQTNWQFHPECACRLGSAKNVTKTSKQNGHGR